MVGDSDELGCFLEFGVWSLALLQACDLDVWKCIGVMVFGEAVGSRLFLVSSCVIPCGGPRQRLLRGWNRPGLQRTFQMGSGQSQAKGYNIISTVP